MAISTVQWIEQTPNSMVYYYSRRFLGTGSGKTNILRGSTHGKLRLLEANIVTIVNATSAPTAKIEDGSGNAATAATAASATNNTVTSMAISSFTVFDADEDIDVNVTVAAGGATSAYMVEAYLQNAY